MVIQTDIAVLGGGPGGYVAALRAAQLGARVALIEHDRIGGVCLNVGCMPTKALLAQRRGLPHAATGGQLWPAPGGSRRPRLAGHPGAQGRRLSPNWWAASRSCCSRAGVRVIRGRGRFTAPRTLAVDTAEGALSVEAARGVVVATGSRPVRLPLPGIDLPGVIDSTGALALEDLPRRLLIVGGGVVGVELADVLSAFGVQVTVVEMLDRLLPQMDADLGAGLAWTFGQRGVQVHLNSRLERVDAAPERPAGRNRCPGGPAHRRGRSDPGCRRAAAQRREPRPGSRGGASRIGPASR